MPETTNPALMRSFNDGQSTSSLFTMKLFALLVVIMLVGVGTGYVLAQQGGDTGIKALDRVAKSANIKAGATYGSDDMETFSDTVEGELKDGGEEGEGSHHLVRPGGEGQNVYLTSSIVDLSDFEGRQIKVWGQTQKAQNVGWLMDVGKVEVLK